MIVSSVGPADGDGDGDGDGDASCVQSANAERPLKPASASRHIVLIGLPGVGKSSVGKYVAERLGRAFIDLDTLIERTSGCSIAQFFRHHGEPEFRLAETEATRALMLDDRSTVVAPGGGWITNADAVAHLRCASRIIYLRVTPDEAVRRMGRGIARRPLLCHGDPGAAMSMLYEARRFQYERYADMTVETTGVRRPDVIARVLELVLAAERDFEREND